MKVCTVGVLPPLQGADGILPAGCPSRTVIDHLSSKRGVLIPLDVWNGPQRWSELRRNAPGSAEAKNGQPAP